MPYDLLHLQVLLPSLLVVLFRVAGISISAPFFSSTVIPRRVKIGLAMVTSLMAFPMVQPMLPTDLTLVQALTGIVGEVMVGLGIGLGMSLVFLSTQIAGLMIAQQGGLALGQIYNPELDTQTTPLGHVFFLGLMGVFLAIDGHVAVFKALLESFQFVPPLTFHVTPSVVELFSGLLTSAFVLAIRLAGPALIALMLVTLAMGFISRTVPQLNILAVGFSIRSSVALLMAAVSLSVAQDLLVDGVVDTMDALRAMLRGLG
ncbi:MAG: flagellar biosynthetic protein FliR [Phycisphaerae bacterium]|nr:flagellar biosynthetic protein FliR [Phycisphaerae bacterium]